MKILDFRSSEIVSDALVSVIATYCAGGEWRSVCTSRLVACKTLVSNARVCA